MLEIPKHFKFKQNSLRVVKLTNYEEQPVTRQFQEVGKDVRITLESLSDGERIQKAFYLDNKGNSIDSGYLKSMLKYTSALYAEDGFIDFSTLIGKSFIVGIEETFSSKTLQTYQNISIFLPLESDFVKQIKNI